MTPPDPAPPTRTQAVALRYDPAETAPQVIAKGYGTIAEHIIARAREHGLYVHRSAELVSLLMQVDLDAHIPPELYRAVAELLAWLYALEHPMAPRQPPASPPR
ncbi:MAG: EscU/YscU/HrcU family type III secretion system export apparatus switch protein [Burkholderiaceae bacterium]|uniref:EscU/YscU/HrcU family type III secretion system export apparatus switch protein n=1 Tax=Castellaniella sp. TaxID=1955812 RepID=UPI00355DBF18